MSEVFSQEGKRRKIQWWRGGLSEITVNFDVRGLCMGDPRVTLSKLFLGGSSRAPRRLRRRNWAS